MHTFLPIMLADQLPLTLRVGLFLAVFIGLAFWLLGRRLARITCAMVGLLTGLALGMTIASTLLKGEWGMLVIAACALGGMALAWLLYRFWMSLSLAAALALAGPVAFMAWQGSLSGLAPGLNSVVGSQTANPAISSQNKPKLPSQAISKFEPGTLGKGLIPAAWSQSIKDSNSPLNRIIDNEIKKVTPLHAQTGSLELGTSFAPVSLQVLALPGHILNSIYLHIFNHVVIQTTKDYFHSYWDRFANLTLRDKQVAMLLAGCGAMIGLLIGLLFPTLAASMVSALLGSLFMLLAGSLLLGPYLPATVRQNSGPHVMLLALSLITLSGIFVQWTMSRRPTDK